MSYDPSNDRFPSPTEMGELFVATRDIVVARGSWEFGGANEPAPASSQGMDRPVYGQSQLYGLPGAAELGGKDGKKWRVMEYSKYPIASYPPTHRLEVPEVSILRAMVPDAAGVLGLKRSLTVFFHEPYIKWDGDMTKELPDVDTTPEPGDCAFFLGETGLSDIDRRMYKIAQSNTREDYARGVRTDTKEGVPQHEESGAFPDIRFREWECLMEVTRSLAILMLDNPAPRTPQEE